MNHDRISYITFSTFTIYPAAAAWPLCKYTFTWLSLRDRLSGRSLHLCTLHSLSAKRGSVAGRSVLPGLRFSIRFIIVSVSRLPVYYRRTLFRLIRLFLRIWSIVVIGHGKQGLFFVQLHLLSWLIQSFSNAPCTTSFASPYMPQIL